VAKTLRFCHALRALRGRSKTKHGSWAANFTREAGSLAPSRSREAGDAISEKARSNGH
jgi:hypothetical protein